MGKQMLKNDRFRKTRGGHSRFLMLFCQKCGNEIAVYQKDGPGILKRIYLDRIVVSEQSPSEKNLVCESCTTILGVKTIYEKENRPAYRLFVAAVGKKLLKSDRLPTTLN